MLHYLSRLLARKAKTVVQEDLAQQKKEKEIKREKKRIKKEKKFSPIKIPTGKIVEEDVGKCLQEDVTNEPKVSKKKKKKNKNLQENEAQKPEAGKKKKKKNRENNSSPKVSIRLFVFCQTLLLTHNFIDPDITYLCSSSLMFNMNTFYRLQK